jgi:hypothetical protein
MTMLSEGSHNRTGRNSLKKKGPRPLAINESPGEDYLLEAPVLRAMTPVQGPNGQRTQPRHQQLGPRQELRAEQRPAARPSLGELQVLL